MTFRKKTCLFCAIGTLSLFSLISCAPQAQLDSLDRNVSGLLIQTNRMEQDIKTLQKRLDTLQKGGGGAVDRRSFARVNSRLDRLESELMRLNGLLEQLQFNQEQQQAEINQIKYRLGVTGPSGNVTASKKPQSSNTTSIKNTLSQKKPTGEIVQKPQPKPVQVDLYTKGLQLFRENKFQEAKETFREFIKENPNSSKVPNAYFWIGECEYKLSRFEEAILEYNKVITQYPKSNKVPDAYLKQGFAFAKLGDKESAKILLKKLIKKYPYSSQAKVAKRQLRLLK